jgi:hypothetical protein
MLKEFWDFMTDENTQPNNNSVTPTTPPICPHCGWSYESVSPNQSGAQVPANGFEPVHLPLWIKHQGF